MLCAKHDIRPWIAWEIMGAGGYLSKGSRSKLRFRAKVSWPIGEGAEWSSFITTHA